VTSDPTHFPQNHGPLAWPRPWRRFASAALSCLSIAITLGSGLGGVIDTWSDAVRIPDRGTTSWPRSTVTVTPGAWHSRTGADIPVVALAGRSHRYEGIRSTR
jgi:purine nucleoside phosphorylase